MKQLKGKFLVISCLSFFENTLLSNRFFIFIEVSNNTMGASIGLENDNDMFLWNVIFEGPNDTLYEVSSTSKEQVKNCVVCFRQR